MKRSFIFAFLLLLIDQGLKSYCQLFLNTHDIVFNTNYGLTYMTNDALWFSSNISNKNIYIVFGFAFLVWCLVIYLVMNYQKHFRKSIIVDIAFAFYTVGILGNMIDKLLFGVIRDIIRTPLVITNIADLSGILGLGIFCLEFIFYPPSRKLLKSKSV